MCLIQPQRRLIRLRKQPVSQHQNQLVKTVSSSEKRLISASLVDRALAGQRSHPVAVSVGVFLDPRCHLPPNSRRVVDQHLFTLCLQDGTNLITPHSPVAAPPETISVICSGQRELLLTAIMNTGVGPSGRELLNNDVLAKSRSYIFTGNCSLEEGWSVKSVFRSIAQVPLQTRVLTL